MHKQNGYTSLFQRKYVKLKNEIESFVDKKGFEVNAILPISAVNGDNLINRSSKMKYYRGKTLYELLEDLKLKHRILIMEVQL